MPQVESIGSQTRTGLVFPLFVLFCLGWVPEGSLAGILWVGFWGLGGPWGV